MELKLIGCCGIDLEGPRLRVVKGRETRPDRRRLRVEPFEWVQPDHESSSAAEVPVDGIDVRLVLFELGSRGIEDRDRLFGAQEIEARAFGVVSEQALEVHLDLGVFGAELVGTIGRIAA